jgi:hypothetical protein
MFQFPGFAHLAVYHAFSMVGCPIRTSADQFVLANPRSFSQLITSFFASESLGIPHTPFLTSFSIRFTYVLDLSPHTHLFVYMARNPIKVSASLSRALLRL